MFLNDFNRDSNFRNVDINMNNINCNSQCMRAAVDLYINKIQERLWKSFLFKKPMLWTYIFSKSKDINILNLITLYNISIEFPMIRLKVWLVINSCKDKKKRKKEVRNETFISEHEFLNGTIYPQTITQYWLPFITL